MSGRPRSCEVPLTMPAMGEESEMICGTFVFEDQAIAWDLQPGNRVSYRVQNSVTGKMEQVECDWAGFGAAMALAIAGDEIVAATQLYAIAEPVMPKDQDLRWIP